MLVSQALCISEMVYQRDEVEAEATENTSGRRNNSGSRGVFPRIAGENSIRICIRKSRGFFGKGFCAEWMMGSLVCRPAGLFGARGQPWAHRCFSSLCMSPCRRKLGKIDGRGAGFRSFDVQHHRRGQEMTQHCKATHRVWYSGPTGSWSS